MTLQDAADLCAMRKALTGAAAELAAARGLSGADAKRLGELVDLMEHPYDSERGEEFESFLRTNLEYEAVVANASGNRRLAEAIARLFDDFERILRIVILYLPFSRDRALEKRALVQAITDGDSRRARELMEDRVDESTEAILGALRSSREVITANIPGRSQLNWRRFHN